MSNRNFLGAIVDALLALFGKKPSAPITPAIPTEPIRVEPAVIVTRRVLMVVYNPVVDPSNGLRLSEKMNWRRAEDLSAAFIADILEASGGLARYQIIQRVDANEFPVKADGFQYNAQSYLDAVHGTAPMHKPDLVDYPSILQKYNLLQRVANGEVDEVWLFGFPHAGFYESVMGGMGAFWCNSEPLTSATRCPRRFIIMGFSLERGVGEMHEAFGHRAESIMEKVYERIPSDQSMWRKFTRYDKAFPGLAEVGNIHYAPNSQSDYDWGNPRIVPSTCDDWYNYPNFKGTVKQVNCAEWGNGEIRAHHVWWLKHLPKTAGSLRGIANNWWQYIMDPNRVAI